MKNSFSIKRRQFFKKSAALGLSLYSLAACDSPPKANHTPKSTALSNHNDLFFKISLAQWSLHRSFETGTLKVLDFAAIAKKEFGITAVEYVNGFYAGKGGDTTYWKAAKKRADDQGVKNLLIMIDEEGYLGNTDDKQRKKAVENHYKWVDSAAILGCHSVRVNAFGEGSKEAVGAALADGLGRLAEYAQKVNINVLIENHGLYSSDAQWVIQAIQKANQPNCGTLPDFGNWCMSQKWGSTQDGTCQDVYDRYRGVKEFLPYAKGVSAKSYRFNKNGEEEVIDYTKMLKIVQAAGFSGHIGIEYEGDQLSEMEGIRATQQLLIKTGKKLQ